MKLEDILICQRPPVRQILSPLCSRKSPFSIKPFCTLLFRLLGRFLAFLARFLPYTSIAVDSPAVDDRAELSKEVELHHNNDIDTTDGIGEVDTISIKLS